MELGKFNQLDERDIIDLGVDGLEPVEKRLIEGDIEGNILYEITLDDDSLTPLANQIILKGGRVFKTDSPFAELPEVYIHSEVSLALQKPPLNLPSYIHLK